MRDEPAIHRRGRCIPGVWLSVVLCAVLLAGSACFRRSTLPATLTDREFWGLIEALSEPAGTFTLSDNVVSNEPFFAGTVKRLRPTGGAYIGVGPEQNFSYIAALRPAMAFIIDIRRENLDLHLLYKGLFELSTDRADFVSRLFSRPRPAGLVSAASVDEIFEQYDHVAPSQEQYTKERNARPRAAPHHARLPVVSDRSRLDRPCVRRFLHRRADRSTITARDRWTPSGRHTGS